MITRDMMKELRLEINEALEEVGKRYDVTLKLGNGVFESETAHFKLNVTANGKNGEALDIDAVNFKKYATRFGLKPEMLGKSFVYHGVVYTVTGLAPKRHKRPLLARTNSGTRFAFAASIAPLIGK